MLERAGAWGVVVPTERTMMIDTSDEAIAADLERAARSGTPGQVAVWVAWAQIRAQLRQTAVQPSSAPPVEPLPAPTGSADIQIVVGPSGDSYIVPTAASWEDRVTAAARMLQLDPDFLRGLLTPVEHVEGEPSGVSFEPVVIEAPADLELDIDEDDIDDDFFREARAARDK